ncbi:hypothetical protein CGCSCA5_v012084 [Colletotrichum siamense]|nr:hypothetical protein CGCSCA5_v012084 [Colletotrichum siamense]
MVSTLGAHPARRLESAAGQESHARSQKSTKTSGQKKSMVDCLPVETTPRHRHTGIWDRSGAMPGCRCNGMRSRPAYVRTVDRLVGEVPTRNSSHRRRRHGVGHGEHADVQCSAEEGCQRRTTNSMYPSAFDRSGRKPPIRGMRRCFGLFRQPVSAQDVVRCISYAWNSTH